MVNNNNIHTSLAGMEVAATDNSYRRLLLLLLLLMLLLCSKLLQAVQTAVHQLMFVNHNLQVEGVANLVLLPRNYILLLFCTLKGLFNKYLFFVQN